MAVGARERPAARRYRVRRARRTGEGSGLMATIGIVPLEDEAGAPFRKHGNLAAIPKIVSTLPPKRPVPAAASAPLDADSAADHGVRIHRCAKRSARRSWRCKPGESRECRPKQRI